MRTAFGAASVGTKIGIGFAAVLALSAGIGTVGLYGLQALGQAVERTSAAAGTLTSVNAAAGYVGTFTGSGDPAELDKARAALQSAAQSMETVAGSEKDVTDLIGRFRQSLDGLQSATVAGAEAEGAFGTATEAIAKLAAKAENDSARQADTAETDANNLQITLDSMGKVQIEAGTVRALLLRASLFTTRYTTGGNSADLEQVGTVIGDAATAVDRMASLAGWPGTQDAVGAVKASFGSLAAAFEATKGLRPSGAPDPLVTLAAEVDRTVAAADALVEKIDGLIAEERTRLKAIASTRTRARVLSGLSRNFGDRVTGISLPPAAISCGRTARRRRRWRRPSRMPTASHGRCRRSGTRSLPPAWAMRGRPSMPSSSRRGRWRTAAARRRRPPPKRPTGSPRWPRNAVTPPTRSATSPPSG